MRPAFVALGKHSQVLTLTILDHLLTASLPQVSTETLGSKTGPLSHEPCDPSCSREYAFLISWFVMALPVSNRTTANVPPRGRPVSFPSTRTY